MFTNHLHEQSLKNTITSVFINSKLEIRTIIINIVLISFLTTKNLLP